MSQFQERQKERISSLAFDCFQALDGLDAVHPHGGKQFALHSLSIQMLISSSNNQRNFKMLI